jgi:Fic family protein
MNELKINRIWKHIEFDNSWLELDTSILDDIKESWFERREVLQNNSDEYEQFLIRLKREHAIETGIVERMYDLRKGITETLIKEGFVKSYLSHGDTNIPEDDLMAHLHDHLEAVDFIFDVVKSNRQLTTGFINELHRLVTDNQNYAEGRDQFGNRTQIPLIKGKYKERENNPTREDGTKVLYCPPEHVASEMDNLVRIYDELESDNVHPLIIATWFHHAFTTIHPYQDGNGRVARLLTSLIFIKHGYFPFTVLREEAKAKYINSLEEADNGNPQSLITYFGEVQKRNIQKALNLKEVTSKSLEEVQKILVQKIENWRIETRREREQKIEDSREKVFEYCYEVLNELGEKLRSDFNGNADVVIKSCSFNNERVHRSGTRLQGFFYKQIVSYAKKHDYYFNRSLPKAWFTFRIELSTNKTYQLGITIHHYGYDDSTIAIGSFLEFKSSSADEIEDTTLPLEIPPHVISVVNNNIDSKKKNIRSYLEGALTLAMAQIASEMG